MDFAGLADHRVKIRASVKKDRYLDIARELKTVEHKGDGDSNCNRHACKGPQKLGTGEELEIGGRIQTVQLC